MFIGGGRKFARRCVLGILSLVFGLWEIFKLIAILMLKRKKFYETSVKLKKKK